MNPEKVLKTFEYFLLTQVSHPQARYCPYTLTGQSETDFCSFGAKMEDKPCQESEG